MISQIPKAVIEGVDALLLHLTGKPTTFTDFQYASGGCINNGGMLKTTTESFFLKWNSATRFPKMFQAEAQGLKLLKSVNCMPIPEVIGEGENGAYAFLLLEYINQTPKAQNYWEVLGTTLANLHQNTHQSFGLDHHNYIGSLPQSNNNHLNWSDFFIQERLQPQVALALEKHQLPSQYPELFEKLYKKLPDIFPDTEKPGLIHGDLWSGNLIVNDTGLPCLIDPAVYYASREIEIAFTKLFGGFDDSFYQSYQEAFPLIPGFAERQDIYNLYPLMVHVNLFGSGYLSQVDMILRRYLK